MTDPSSMGDGARLSLIEKVRSLFRSTASVKPVSRTDDPRDPAGEAPIVQPTPQHPLAPEREPPPLDWAIWNRMQQETFRHGWSFARFAVKAPPPEDRMGCLFGIVRGAWGIAAMDFYLCQAGTFSTLNAISHLPSGLECGLFLDQEAAATACEIAERLSCDWEDFDFHADSAATTAAIRHMQAAWEAGGILRLAIHAHATADPSSPPLSIWFKDYTTIISGRPEKLS